MILVYYALFLATRHRFEEGATWAAKATAIDPLSPFAHALGGLALFDARHYEDAIRYGERALELQPDYALGVWPVVFASLQLGEGGRAVDLLERLIVVTNRAPMYLGMLGMTYAFTSREAEARAVLNELRARKNREYVFPLAALITCVGLRDRDGVRDQLLECIEDGYTGAGIEICVGPFIDEFGRDPELADALRRLRLVPRQ